MSLEDDYQWSGNEVRGHGSFGTVYVGYMETGEKVAVKVCNGKSHHDIWKAEVDVLKSCLNATNIVQIRSCKDGSMALELADTTLDEMVKDSVINLRGLSQATVGDLMVDLTAAVAFLQKKNIAHRDIKPGNILVFRKPLRKSGNLFKLGDMGTSTAKNSNETLVGTYAFLVPTFCKALAEGRKPFEKVQSSMSGFAIDAWTIGCTVFFASTSLYPFRVENSNNPYEAVEQIEQGDITVVKVDDQVARSKRLPHHRFDKWYAYAVSRYILHCLEVYLKSPADDVCESLTKMISTMQNAVEVKFIGLKNRRFFKHADIFGAHEYLQQEYPSLSEVFETKDLSNIKLLSENGVIEGGQIKFETLSTNTVHFIISSEKSMDKPCPSPSIAFDNLLSNKKENVTSWFTFCSREYNRAQQELKFMSKSIKAMQCIERRVISDGMIMYKCSENTRSIIETFKDICSSELFERSETETLQYYGCSELFQDTLKNEIDQMEKHIRALNNAQLDFTEYKQFLENLDINIDALNDYIGPFRTQYRSNTTHTRKLMGELCASMKNIFEQSANLQQLLIEHAQICVIIFNHITKIKLIHQKLITLVSEHQTLVRTKLDRIHEDINISNTTPVDPGIVQELIVIAGRLRQLVIQQ